MPERLNLVYLDPLHRRIEFTIFNDISAQQGRPLSASLRELDAEISKTKAKTKEGLPLIKAAVFGDLRTRRGSLRSNDNVLKITGIEADYDRGEIAFEDACSLVHEAGITGLLYTTPSHRKPGKGERWRIICPLSHPCKPDERGIFVARLNGLFTGQLGDESFVLSQAFFFGSADDSAIETHLVAGRRYIDQAGDLDSSAIGKRADPRGIEDRPEQQQRKAFNDDIEQLARCLAAIPVADDYETWLRVGMAIHFESDGSDIGRLHWHQWSAGPDHANPHPKYKAEDLDSKWPGFANRPDRPITGATLIEMARPHGYVHQGGGRREGLVLAPEAPILSAREFIARRPSRLVYCRGSFYTWAGTNYQSCDGAELKRELYRFLEVALVEKPTGLVAFNPTINKVAEVVAALKAVVGHSAARQPPFWLDSAKTIDPTAIIACKNGYLNIATRQLHPHDPDLFNVTCLPFDYDPEAAAPNWLKFLNQLWPGDSDDARASRDTVHEILGLMLTGDTRFQKIFMLIGPKRSGKGTIARVLKALLGATNVAGPTLASLGTNFGLSPLIDKRCAIVADARLSGRSDISALAERLLSISGEDTLTIDRKYRDHWSGKLDVRFLILTNELPRIGDASGTIASRFILLKLRESFYGREDLDLGTKLDAELPGIMNHALLGLDRLRTRGKFEMPKSSLAEIVMLENLASPVRAFLRDWCDLEIGNSDLRINVKTLFDAYRKWAEIEGIKPGDNTAFGRNLNAAAPGIMRRGDGSKRFYQGIDLSEDGDRLYAEALKTR